MPSEPERPSMMEKQNSVTMEYFLETSHLDADTAALLKKYDKDGNGSFSKDEVAAIIMDLREAMRSNQELGTSNKLFKRLLIASCVFCVLLLASMFGLSYAVAALTAKTDVDSTGALTKAGSSAHVSTDSRAETHIVEYNEDGNLCITNDELALMVEEVHEGKQVIFDAKNEADGTTSIRQLSGIGMLISNEDGVACFKQGDGDAVCFIATDKCDDSNSSGRKLTQEGRDQRRRRMPSSFNGSYSGTCSCTCLAAATGGDICDCLDCDCLPLRCTPSPTDSPVSTGSRK